MQADLIPLWAAIIPAVIAAMVFAYIAVRLTQEFRQRQQYVGGSGSTGASEALSPAAADIVSIRGRLEAFVLEATQPGDPDGRELMARASGWLRGCTGTDAESAYLAACDERFRAAAIVLDDETLDSPQKVEKLLQLFEPQEPV